jgi:1-pyrroline-5-carboxylate dehydrogenase
MMDDQKLSWATVDPVTLGVKTDVYIVLNCVGGEWLTATGDMDIPNPLDKEAPPLFTIPDTQVDELQPFLASLRKVLKSGVHNPIKNPERYVKLDEISRKVRCSSASR